MDNTNMTDIKTRCAGPCRVCDEMAVEPMPLSVVVLGVGAVLCAVVLAVVGLS